MSGFLRDCRQALRGFARGPLTPLLAVATLALGVGVNALLFSVVHAVLLRPLPAADPERLLYLVQTDVERGGHYGVAWHNYAGWRDRSCSFAALAALRRGTVTVTGADAAAGAERLERVEVSPEYFPALGAAPALGRTLGEADRAAAERGEPTAVLSDRLWRRRFGADPQVIGRTLTLDGEPHTVVGVMGAASPAPFLGWAELWTPLAVDEAAAEVEPLHGFSVLGRLRPEVSLEAARRDLDALARQLAAERPETYAGWGVEAAPVRQWIFEGVGRTLYLLWGAVGLVLVIACANVANLLLSRGLGRRRELAVRRALGAGRWRLARLLLAESVLLGLAGGAAGLVLAAAGVRLLPVLGLAGIPRFEETALDGAVLAVTLALALAAGLAAGLVPAVGLSAPARRLGGGRAGTPGRRSRRTQDLLVAAQMALAVVVVAGSVLTVRSFLALRAVDPGFRPHGLLTCKVEIPAARHPDKAARIALWRQVLESIEALPGVEAVGLSGQPLPLSDGQGVFEFYLAGEAREPGKERRSVARMVSSGYFTAMGIALRRGTLFADGDTWESSHAVVVNETAARQLWPGADATQQVVVFTNGETGRVIGVVADVPQGRLHLAAGVEIYVPWGMVEDVQRVVVRSARRPAALAASVRRAVAAAAPAAPVFDLATGEELVARSLADRRLPALLWGLFAVLALALGAVGVYGVVAQGVGRRRREIGIRIALGAAPSAVRRSVVGGGLLPVAAGLVAGLVLGLGAGRLLASQLYGVSAGDPLTYAGTAGVLLAAALAACLPPARRAARTDPAATLRE